ncbi:hypothetical protein Tco_1024699 [Tanacetum coccineum]
MKLTEESEPEPESVKRKTSSKIRVKKKVTLSADDNIISDDPNVALELAKSISKTEAKEARQVHATHARIMTEYVPESAKKKSGGRSTGGSSEGTGSKPEVPDESTVVSAISSEGTGDEQDNEHFDDDNDDVKKDDKDGDADDEGGDHISDIQDADDEVVETESDEDDIYKYKIRVRKDEDEEMINVKVDESHKGDEEIIDAAKADAEKTLEVKDDAKRPNSLHQALAYMYI